MSCISPLPDTNVNTSNYTSIIDSAAYLHMANEINMFDSIKPYTSNAKEVLITDGNSSTNIEGIENITYIIDNTKVTMKDVLFLPGLSHYLFSTQIHVKEDGHFIHIENGLASIA